MDKRDLLNALVEAVRGDFESFRRSSQQARSTGGDAQSRSEGKYDTRSTEENYLADGLARQAQAALEAASALEQLEVGPAADGRIALGALVEVEFVDAREWFLLAPAGGGVEVPWQGRTVTVLSPDSPLGKQLLGKAVGEATTSPRAVVRAVV